MNPMLSELYWDFILSGRNVDFLDKIPPEDVVRLQTGIAYESVYVPASYLDTLQPDDYAYYAIPKCYTLLDMEVMNQSGITLMQNYPGLELKGEGVLIGIVDTGIDYQNRVFRNLDGSSRIAAIWDQTLEMNEEDREEFPFSATQVPYGSLYLKEALDEALATANPLEQVPTIDQNGHGTYVASVAAGGGNAEAQFLGAAPNAGIAMVKLKEMKTSLREFYFTNPNQPLYQENDIMLGIHYLTMLAEQMQMPLVLCVALGTNSGGHIGKTPLSQLLEACASRNDYGVVVGSGNEANQRHHFRKTLSGRVEQGGERPSADVELQVEEGMEGFVMELWTENPNVFAVSIISPRGERIPSIPIRQNRSANYGFVLESTQVYVDYRLLVEQTNSELIFFRFQEPTGGIWRLQVELINEGDGIFHIWLPASGMLTADAYFLESDPDNTVMTPGNAATPITVATYNSNDNSIAIRSGRGYTRNNQIKPDMTSPGVAVLGAVPEMAVSEMDSGGRFVRRTGSSAATAMTAGAMALLIEWAVFKEQKTGIDTSQLKSLLILGANRDESRNYPNRIWGYGTLNLYRVFEVISRL